VIVVNNCFYKRTHQLSNVIIVNNCAPIRDIEVAWSFDLICDDLECLLAAIALHQEDVMSYASAESRDLFDGV